jgi:branched-chain amino acid transport system permease protein
MTEPAGSNPKGLRAARQLSTPVVLMVVVAVVLLLAGSSGSQLLSGAATTAGVNLILAVGLFIFVGTTGIVSFGHMAMVGIGAYATAICAATTALKVSSITGMPHWLASVHLPLVPSLLIGGVVAGLFALVASVPLVRLTGLAASLATFAILIIVNTVLTNWNSITGGVTGYDAAPISTTTRETVLWAILAIGVAYAFKESRTGLRLRASREDEAAALGMGANVRRDRAIAFALSGLVVGIGGGLSGLQSGDLTPSAYYLDTTFLIVVMVVVGGVNSLSGAVIGSLLISAVSYVLNLIQGGDVVGIFSFSGRAGIEDAGLAVITLIVLVRRADGLFGHAEIGDLAWDALRRRRRMRGTPGDATVSGTGR